MTAARFWLTSDAHVNEKVVILAGIAPNICVLFTANDAYMRDFDLFVPSDCMASNTEEENRYALDQIRKVLKADNRPSTEISFEALRHAEREE